MVTPTMMRQLWALVESTQANTLLHVDDSALVHWLLKQLMAQQQIDSQAASSLSTYIQTKLPLIRDTAEGRKIVGQGCH
jgi:succinate dehydrogenase flavin-adding protein (antitoxin of CptAB toxin-antitoxin module)